MKSKNTLFTPGIHHLFRSENTSILSYGQYHSCLSWQTCRIHNHGFPLFLASKKISNRICPSICKLNNHFFLCNSPLFHFPSLDTVDLTFYTPSQISVKYYLYIYIIQRCNRAHMSPKLPVSIVVQQEPQKKHQTLEKKTSNQYAGQKPS
jgi:hypothetical protein